MNAGTNNHKSSVYGDGIPWSNEAGKTERLPRSVLYYPVVNNKNQWSCANTSYAPRPTLGKPS